MPNEMTAEEATEKLESMVDGIALYQKETGTFPNCVLLSQSGIEALRYAASVLRRVASGELAPVVHAHWNYTSRPNEDCMGGSHDVIECSHCKEDYDAEYDHCPSCGALMDGKDDSHAD